MDGLTKWEEGNFALLTCTRSIHHGQTVRLLSRHVGEIIGLGKTEGRPYWKVELPDGSVTSEFEDSLGNIGDRR